MKRNTILLVLFTLLFMLSCANNQKAKHTEANTSQEEISKSEQASTSEQVQQDQQISTTSKEYFLDNITIKLNQEKDVSDGNLCTATIITTKDKMTIDSVGFYSEPVGGSYGISKGLKINGHFIFTKHGDYDGRTIIVNKNGKIHNIIGGLAYLDEASNLLISNYESDLAGFSLFDLKQDSVLMEMEDFENAPRSFHKDFGNRYFIACYNQEDEGLNVWEIESDFETLMQVEIQIEELNESNELKNITQSNVECVCEK